jgi:hypothetical protein
MADYVKTVFVICGNDYVGVGAGTSYSIQSRNDRIIIPEGTCPALQMLPLISACDVSRD